MFLSANGGPVVLVVVRDPVRHRPRGQRAVVLESQMPMKPPGVMLVDHEALLASRPRPGALWLWRGLEAPLAAIGLELVVGHVRTLAPANFGDLVRNSEPGSHSSSRTAYLRQLLRALAIIATDAPGAGSR